MDSIIPLERISCLAKYLCPDRKGNEQYCFLVNHDYPECKSFDEKNVMLISPAEIQCTHAFDCQYAGKRETHCTGLQGYLSCGRTVNSHIPEGEIPRELVDKIREVIQPASA